MNGIIQWQTGTARDCVKASYRQLNKVFHYMDMERQDEPKLELYVSFAFITFILIFQIQHSAERLKSALAEHNAEYKTFKNMLDMANILLDKRVLAHLAIYEPLTFKVKFLLYENRVTYIVNESLESVTFNTYTKIIKLFYIFLQFKL